MMTSEYYAPSRQELRSVPRIEGRLARQLFPKRSLAIANAFRHLHVEHHIQIAASAPAQRQAASPDAHFLPVLGAGGNFDSDLATERWHRQVGAQHGLPRRQVQIAIQVIAFDAVVRMFGEANAEK